jgi:16S rRNA (guanine(527)-N(7))-methyltransferase RsmG
VSSPAELDDGLTRLGLEVGANQRQQLLAFVQLLLKWNRAFNLISRRDEPRVVPRHLLDSLILCPWLVGGRIGDLGSGAGFPGIPLAIVRPELSFTLIDRSERRTRFLRQVQIDLRLDNVEVVTRDLARYRPEVGFDTVTTRAVAHPSAIWLLAQPLLSGPAARALLQCGEQEASASFPGAARAQRVNTPVPGLARGHFVWVVEAG